MELVQLHFWGESTIGPWYHRLRELENVIKGTICWELTKQLADAHRVARELV